MSVRIFTMVLSFLLCAVAGADQRLGITYHGVVGTSAAGVYTQKIVVMVSNPSDEAVRNLTLTSVTDQPSFEQQVFVGDVPPGESQREVVLKSVPVTETGNVQAVYGQPQMTWIASYQSGPGMEEVTAVRAYSYQSRSFGQQ